MRFRFEIKKTEKKGNGRKQTHLRMLCFFMMVTMLCSGCGSIILSGNLEFSANAPIEPASVDIWQNQMPDPTFGYLTGDKYNIDGTQAFTLLPGHLCPADVPKLNEAVQTANESRSADEKLKEYRADFKVIDYNSTTQCFVYAYYTPYLKQSQKYLDGNYPELGDTGLTVAKSGTGPFDPEHASDSNEIDGGVLVLMSYNPVSKAYKVFLSTTYSKEEDAKNDNRCLAGMAGLTAGIDEDMAKESGNTEAKGNTVQDGKKDYFIFAHDHLYVFNENGDQLFATDYHAIVESKAKTMASGWKYYRYSVSNVEIDGNGIPYFTLDMEVSNEDFSKGDKQAEEIINSDKDYEEDKNDDGQGDEEEEVGGITYFHGTFSCLRASIGGSNGIHFLSQIPENTWNEMTDTKLINLSETHTYAEMAQDVPEKTVNGDFVYDEAGNQVFRKETFDEVKERLQKNPDPKITDLYSNYMNNTQVQGKTVYDTINTGFTEFASDSGVVYKLAGYNNGRVVPYLTKDGSGTGKNYIYRTNNYSYEESYWIFWSKTHWVYYNMRDLQDRMISGLISNLNASGYRITDLKPGSYGGLDWAYYQSDRDGRSYSENNGTYLYGNDMIKGHAQPLVSSRTFGLGSSMESFNEADWHLEADAAGDIYYVYAQGRIRLTIANYSCLNCSRYYYNNSLGKYSSGDDSSEKDSLGDDWALKTGTISSHKTSNGTVPIPMECMLRNNLPFVAVFKQDNSKNGGTYLKVNNDDARKYVLPTMTLEESRTITLTYKSYINNPATGKDEEYYSKSYTLRVPYKYSMQFPKDCYIQIEGDTWTGNMVKAGDKDLNALTWYSMRGDRLAQPGLYTWINRNPDYPIYDNASDKLIGSNNDTEGGWKWYWLWYYYNNEVWDFYNNNKDSYFSTLQIEKQGKNSLLYDRLVPGQAQDVGIWKVGTQDVVAYFTDQVIRFYKKQEGKKYGSYAAVAEVRIDELRGLTTGYIMKEEESGAASYNVNQNTGMQSTDNSSTETNQKMAQMGEDAMNTDEAMYKLDSKNILPLDSNLRRFLYFSYDGGLYLLQLLKGGSGTQDWQKQGRIMSLMDGTYYRVFGTGSNQYKVVGFETQEYNYTGAELCMAKVYDLDLSSILADRGATAIEDYLDNLRNIYQTKTHTLLNTTAADGMVTVSIVKPDSNDAEFKRAETILASSDYTGKVYPEFKKICEEYGIDASKATDAENYLKKLRDAYKQQRAAISEMYKFLGINATSLTDNWRYLQYEGRLFNASYESLLEQTMVEMILSDNYLDATITPRLNGLDGMVGVHRYDPAVDGTTGVNFVKGTNDQYVDEYAEYRRQYKEWQLTTTEQQLMASYTQEELQKRNQELSSDQMQQILNVQMSNSESSELQNRDFYKAVTDDLEARFYQKLENGEIKSEGESFILK